MRSLFVCIVTAALLGPAALAEAKVFITVDKSAQRMTVSVDGRKLYDWPVSTGRSGHDTPGGEYRAFRMEKDHYSKEWDDAPMPHSIFFTKAGHAIHGSYDTKKIGSPASAGCVRLAPENAEALFALVEEKGVLNTSVKIVGDLQVALARSGSRRAAAEADRDAAPRRRYGTYAEPARPRYVEPYGGPYIVRRAPTPYELPPVYYERRPYPGYYRW